MKIFSERTVTQMARKSRKNPTNSTEKINFKVYKTAIYARLSKENQQGEKIETQIEEIKNYIENRRIFELVDIYADNGYSGTNFQRPEFERLMEDIRNRKIDCIIVRDLSRFAREHIGAEDYLNNIFPFLGVRFIAINDGYDNLNIEPQEYFMTAFKNLAHEYFAKETSRKVTTAKSELQKQGKFAGSTPAFGYLRDPNDKYKLVINEDEAVIIREIFKRAADGETTRQIAKDLIQREIKGCAWSDSRISAILKKEIYKGTLVQRQTETSFYNNEKRHKIAENEQIRIENAVPAIVSYELWEKANTVVAEREAERHRNLPKNPYKNLAFCGKCDKKLICGFVKKRGDFELNCTKCKSGVFVKGKVINEAVRNHLNLSENVEITKDLLDEKFEKILVFEKKNIILIDRGDSE